MPDEIILNDGSRQAGKKAMGRQRPESPSGTSSFHGERGEKSTIRMILAW
jgi:hypothetical protein